jgi:hypothetical protein
MNPSLTGPEASLFDPEAPLSPAAACEMAIYKLINSPSAKAEYQDYFFGELDWIVAPLLELLGNEVLLIPEVKGKKKPRLRGWNRLRHGSLDDYYFKSLEASVIEGGNLGVLLGKPSGNLCTVDLDRAEAIEPFLAKNPRLADTLTSTGSGVGAQFWLRIRGYYTPKVLKISVTEHLAEKYGGVERNPDTGTYDIGEWRGGQKSTIWGWHESGRRDYEILVREKPVELTMEEILLPKGWCLRLLRPTEFGLVAWEDLTEDERINAADRRRAARRWRGGGGSH